MSAQLSDYLPGVNFFAIPETIRMSETSSENCLHVSGVPFEVAYQALYAHAPEPEDVRREYFLLECD